MKKSDKVVYWVKKEDRNAKLKLAAWIVADIVFLYFFFIGIGCVMSSNILENFTFNIWAGAGILLATTLGILVIIAVLAGQTIAALFDTL